MRSLERIQTERESGSESEREERENKSERALWWELCFRTPSMLFPLPRTFFLLLSI